MYAKSIIAVAALAGAVSAAPVGEKQPPKGWWTEGLEPYMTYHTRYLALQCYNQHDTDFFKSCCSPLLVNEQLSSRPAECTPSDEATASVSSSLAAKYAATGTATADAASPSTTDDAEWEEEEVCESSAIEQATATVADAPKADSASATATATSTSTQDAPAYVAAEPTSSAAAETSSEAPAWTPSPSTTSEEPAQTSQASSNNGGDNHVGGYATYFYQGGNAGACGNVNSDSTPLVAIDQAQWYASGSGSFGSPSSLCGKWLTITNTNNGKSVSAIVADVCPTCANGNSLDLSVGAFTAIASESDGMVPITWTWN